MSGAASADAKQHALRNVAFVSIDSLRLGQTPVSRRERPSARLLPQTAPTPPEADGDQQQPAAVSADSSPSTAAALPSANQVLSQDTASSVTSTESSVGPIVGDSSATASARTTSSGKTMNKTNWSLLDELDARQTELLDQLAELDRRVEALLRECLNGRGEGEGGIPDRALNADVPSKGAPLDPVEDEDLAFSSHSSDLAIPT